MCIINKFDLDRKDRGGRMEKKKIQQTVNYISQACDGERIYRAMKQIARFHRIQASKGYREAANVADQIFAQAGLHHQISMYPADLTKQCFTQTLFREWNCSEAWLKLTAPWNETLCDFRFEEMSLIQRSAAGDFTKEEIPVIYISDDISPETLTEDISGKAIFVEHGFERWTEKVIQEKAAVILTVSMPEIQPVRINVSEDPQLCKAHANLSFHHYTKESETALRGFALSPEAGKRLKKACIEGKEQGTYPMIQFRIDSSFCDGTLENVEAWIEGETEEEVLLTAHLCHPRSSVNDNASGAACGIEAMCVLGELINAGVLKKPKRTIRLLLIPEFTGTYAFLSENEEKVGRIVAGFNLDMVAGTQDENAGPLIIVDTPDCAHAFSGDLGEAILQALSRECAFGGDQVYVPLFSSMRVPFVFGSDHYILSDPTIDIPTVALTQWPDKTYHTSADNASHVDPRMLKRATTIAAAYCYIYSAMDLQYAKELLPITSQRFYKRIDALRRSECANQSYEVFYLKELVGNTLDRYERLIAEETEEKKNLFLEERAQYERLLETIACETWEEQKYAEGKIPMRTFRGPIAIRSVVARMNPEQKAEYDAFFKNYPYAMKCLDYIFYETDGIRTMEEVARRVSYQTKVECQECIEAFYILFEKLGLIQWK